ncbi:MAG: hypothetical protein KH056_04425, partial [Clostridiales bacterium]|nr:hypothetical protein [Clostridiales bacterium]
VGEILGSTDAQNQISTLSMLREFMTQCQKEAEKERNEKGKLYHSLGILGGIGLAILIW